MTTKIHKGDIFYVDFGIGYGSEQKGFRPVLIVQNDKGNAHSATVIVASITTKNDEKAKVPTHCFINRDGGLYKPSMVLLEQIATIDKSRLEYYVGHISDNTIEKINRHLRISFGI